MATNSSDTVHVFKNCELLLLCIDCADPAETVVPKDLRRPKHTQDQDLREAQEDLLL